MFLPKLFQYGKNLFLTLFGAFLVFLLLNSYLLIGSRLTGSDIYLFGQTNYKVLTESMLPTIKPKQYVLLEKGSYQVGDIVAYRLDSGVRIIHRIIEYNGKTVITKGDNNAKNDEPILREQIVGKVTSINYDYGCISFLTSVPGILVPVFIYIFLLIGEHLTKKLERAQKIS